MFDDDKPREACGLFGIAFDPRATLQTRLGLYALQHRGQESAGIMALRQGRCEVQKGMGLVADVFARLPNSWWNEPQTMAIGHVRYSTSGSTTLVNAQPFAVEFDRWVLGLAHNGNLSNSGALRRALKQSGAILQGTTDTELILHLAARHHEPGAAPWAALRQALTVAEGAYSLLALCEDGMAAIRDPHGWRPLVMGRKGDAIIFTSETCALDILQAEYVRDVPPGTMILVRPDGSITEHPVATAPRLAHCMFELVYFARPDSRVFGEMVYDVRRRFGAQLAREAPCDCDFVMPLPDGGLYAALGFAEESGRPFNMGMVRNHYVGRTFIKPNEEDRRMAVRVKLNPIRELIAGKRVCVVDDSIVRGNTSRERVRLLREAGAKEVHMRISCPPHISPCFYGIDFPRAEELLAHNRSLDEVRQIINVDSLGYLSLEGMLGCVRATKPADYCHACWSRQYPVPPREGIPRDELEEKWRQPGLL